MGPLKVSEAFCYICRGILIEPVTLPCLHVFCFTCFEQSMQETSYSCPLCRKRISNWVRSVKRSNKLVNAELWRQIKEQFKEQVRLKLNGEDDGLDQSMQEECLMVVSTSKPGEVAQEFLKLINDFRLERERLKQAEELASKELIVKLTKEEEEQFQLLEKDNILRLEEDKKLAMKIQKEINKEVPSTSQTNSRNTKKSRTCKTSSQSSMDEFLKGFFDLETKGNKSPSSSEATPDDRSTSADSTDSIRLETNHFKPIKKVKRTPPKRYPEGKSGEISLTKVTPLKFSFNNLGASSSSSSSSSPSGKTVTEVVKIHSSHSAFVDTNLPSQGESYESPSKRLRFSSEEPDAGVLKDITLGENNDSNSSTIDDSSKKKSNSGKKSENFMIPSKIPQYSGMETRLEKEDDENDNFDTSNYLESTLEEKIIEEQRQIEKMILQEKEDRELALKLSREWESELKNTRQTRSMIAAAVKRKKNCSSSTKKQQTQKTLRESIASRTRN